MIRENHAVFVNDRRRCATTIARRTPEVLGQPPAPHDGAVTVKGVKVPVDVHGEQIAGRWVPRPRFPSPPG